MRRRYALLCYALPAVVFWKAGLEEGGGELIDRARVFCQSSRLCSTSQMEIRRRVSPVKQRTEM